MSASRSRAIAALEHGRWETAEREWRAVLAEDPDDAGAHAALGLCLVELDRPSDAQAEADRALGIDPELDLAHHVRGRALRDRNRFAEAERAAREAIRIDPDDADHRALTASIRCAQNDWTGTLSEAEAGLALDPANESCVNLRALALTQLGRRAEAASAISGALQRAPESSLAHTNQGWAHLHANRIPEAQECFREALRLDPTNDWAREGMLTALKARNPAFRMLVAYFLFMSRQRTAVRWAIILGIWFGQKIMRGVAHAHPELAPILYPIAFVVILFVVATWIGDPLMNLWMRLDRYGRHALTREQATQANMVGAALASAVALFLIELSAGWTHLPAIAVAVLALPFSSVHACERGWPRSLSWAAAGLFTLLAVMVVIGVHGFGGGDTTADQSSFGLAAFAILALGVFVWSFLLVGWLSQVQPKR
jgi:tetratricopeptide (TPR) repeat protein